jgi:hypothetical protein
MKELTRAEANNLLNLTTAGQVEEWLTSAMGPEVFTDERFWRPVGNQLSNAGAIEVSADEINPLVERVVNSIEAVVELKVAEWRETKHGQQLPSRPKPAIEALFDIPQGEARLLSDREARSRAHHIVEMIFRGSTDVPTIIVRDHGISIHHSEFPSTIVSLGQSTKGQTPYLVGMYGQGGSSTFDKCEYTVIVSRRHPSYLPSGKDDAIGWTVVRKRLATRTHVYSFLVDPDSQEVPFFTAEVGDEIGLEYGTHISHVQYRDLGQFARQQLTNYAFYTLNYRLFDPLLPWILTEERNMGFRGSRTMRGVPYRVQQLPRTNGIGLPSGERSNGTTSVRHNIVFEYPDPDYGIIKVEWWVLQDEQIAEGHRRRDHAGRIEPYRDSHRRYARRRIAITRGGQTHAALTQRVFEEQRLRQVARSIIVHVDTDLLTFEAGASFFASNRADLKTESQAVVEQAITTAIETYRDELRGIERERTEEIVRGRGASDEYAIRSRLDRIITAFTRSQVGAGNKTQRPGHRDREFQGQQVPTYLRFARTNEFGIRPGVPSHVDLVTDASDRTVKDHRTSFIVRSDNNLVDTRISGGSSGRWRVDIYCSPEAAVGTRVELSAYMEVPQVWRVETPSPCRLLVEPPPEPYLGNYPPTFLRFRSLNGDIHVRQGGSRVFIETDAADSLFERATLRIETPAHIPFIGHGHPRNGQVRVSLRVPEDADLGSAGTIKAILTLGNGTTLTDEANLVVQPRRETGGSAGPQQVSNYRIVDVRQIPNEHEESWHGVAEILSCDPWNSDIPKP